MTPAPDDKDIDPSISSSATPDQERPLSRSLELPLVFPGLFEKRDFKLDLRKKTATCPEGQTVPIQLGTTAHFAPERCAECRRRPECTTAGDGRGRSLSIATDERLQKKFTALVRSPHGRARLRERVAIDHTLARHARLQGKQARYRGTRKNLFDSRRTAVVINLETAHRDLARAA